MGIGMCFAQCSPQHATSLAYACLEVSLMTSSVYSLPHFFHVSAHMPTIREVSPNDIKQHSLLWPHSPFCAHSCSLIMLYFLQNICFCLSHHVLLVYCLSSSTRKEFKLSSTPISVNKDFFLFYFVHCCLPSSYAIKNKTKQKATLMCF